MMDNPDNRKSKPTRAALAANAATRARRYEHRDSSHRVQITNALQRSNFTHLNQTDSAAADLQFDELTPVGKQTENLIFLGTYRVTFQSLTDSNCAMLCSNRPTPKAF